MKSSFRLDSYQLANGKWVPSYTEITPMSGGSSSTTPNSWSNKEFDSKKEADKFATDYCITQGFIPEEGK